MDGQKGVGIYLKKDTAAVVCLSLQGRDRKVIGCFSVTVEKTEGQKLQELVRLVTQGCAEKIPMYRDCEVAVALDCAMFMQHNIHSEFTDLKQIAQVIRFDTEEALAMDITDLAIAFKITSSNQSGSELAVFTAQRKQLSDIIISLQSNNIDPITIEPDINCLSRFISQNISLPQDLRSLFCVLSSSSGYFIAFAKSQEILAGRTFLVSPTQNRDELLAREVPLTAALVGTDEPINCIKVFDSTGSVSHRQLGEKLGIEAGSVDLVAAATATPQILADCAEPVDFAIAYGAALSHLEKAQGVNFRSDFMPYQGKKVRLQKAIKFLSISMSVLMLAVGLFFQSQLLQKNKYRSQLRKKFEKEYSTVMFGKKPPAKSNPVKKLAGELRRIRDVKSGQLSITGEESISAKLTLVLEAFNKCAAQTNLKIDKISITSKNITIAGDTSSRKNTLKLLKAIKDKMVISSERHDSKGGRDTFSITIVPKK